MKVINLTPHRVSICDEYGKITKIYERSGNVARVAHNWEVIDIIDDVPLVVRQNERVIGLPEPQEDTVYIVSNIILSYCADRMDLVAPVKQVKINNSVVGCQAFVSNRRKS